ncbi:BglX Beta-glucosidase-related glycosidase [Pyrenophora tritici-repentis]|uniref:beta-glucosidase n=1 Tax=Pyrenophora tritici-repentis TaxID=45151 RepID=A0A2W1DMZ9_9PLEO|nr:BglX, Beta-glucosidase-related glycosidase [Pyrenophora tritici-repentis]KAG9383710.1 Glycoside hydrolase family 3 protein [Pyrenophora tritici-repentis]KAI1514446.1 Glycoside hydrolase family 3 protein [Pyrenophora tritici-repentis]KAI1547545.1 BglX Beta-glucosidase-related glycosidase [Pyrenophora tritici-repentis]KAI1551700.1 BglX Beta-glucosidase-related glycosidase [Pyrenophora tritici-repentis]
MRHFFSNSASFLAGCALLNISNAYDLVRRQQAVNATYKDASAPVEARVADLLSRMTIEEKTAQLIQGDISNWINTTTNAFNQTGLEWNFNVRAGQFYVGYAIPPDWISNGIKIGQDHVMHNTTLGIPAMVQTEAIHGLLVGNATIYNSPIGQACSWDPQLIHDMAVAIATESRSLGINQLFAPLADLARELRFGRVEETYGEDGFLAGEMAYNYVKGVQSLNVSATVKHFAGFSAPEQGLNTGPVHGGERELRTTWLPPFKRAIMDAGAWNIMGAYHSYDGIPSIADGHLQETILREEWGYKYWLTSDAGATDRLCCAFKLCRCKSQDAPIDSEAVTLMALPNGNDVEMGGGSYNYANIPRLMKEGKLDIEIVNRAVSRQLRAKFEMGLFENPYPGLVANLSQSTIHPEEHVKLARTLEADSVVLLENKNATLPLSKSANIAVIGPMGNITNLGDYVVYRSQYNPTNVSPLQGIMSASKGKVTFAQGCERWSNDKSGFLAAVAAAEAADVAVVVVGTWSRDQNELWQGLNATTGEHVDVASLNLVGAMGELVQTIIETGKPTIVVYSSGKPVTEPWISENAAALLQQFYPGEQGGNGLADVLFGDVTPSGKLSVSFPYDVGTLPVYYDYLNSGRSTDPGATLANGTLKFGHQYVLNTPQPLYEFGYGLSYANFTYSNVTLSKTTASASDIVTAMVSVKNTSPVDGKEVVQVYVQDVYASVVVPNMELKGFKKVMIKAGKTVDVSIDLDVSKWGLWDRKMQYVVEKGDFVVHVGSSSKNLRGNGTVTVV